MSPRVLRLISEGNGYWIYVQTKGGGITRIFHMVSRTQTFGAQSISPRAGAANANKPKVTAIKAIALIANDQ